MAVKKFSVRKADGALVKPDAPPAGKLDLASFVSRLTELTEPSRMDKVTAMLRADRFQLFAEVTTEQIAGVVKSQTDHSLLYSCRLDKAGGFFCCTQNLAHCGGLRGALCKHLLVLIIGLTQSGQLEPSLAYAWCLASKAVKPELDSDAAAATFVRYKGAQAGEVDWRPTETIPEDYYAL